MGTLACVLKLKTLFNDKASVTPIIGYFHWILSFIRIISSDVYSAISFGVNEKGIVKLESPGIVTYKYNDNLKKKKKFAHSIPSFIQD